MGKIWLWSALLASVFTEFSSQTFDYTGKLLVVSSAHL